MQNPDQWVIRTGWSDRATGKRSTGASCRVVLTRQAIEITFAGITRTGLGGRNDARRWARPTVAHVVVHHGIFATQVEMVDVRGQSDPIMLTGRRGSRSMALLEAALVELGWPLLGRA